jgi:hypothetical protein
LLGDVKSSLSDAKSSLGDAKSSLSDAKSSLGDAKSSLGDAQGGLPPRTYDRETMLALRGNNTALPPNCAALPDWDVDDGEGDDGGAGGGGPASAAASGVPCQGGGKRKKGGGGLAGFRSRTPCTFGVDCTRVDCYYNHPEGRIVADDADDSDGNGG